MTSALIYSSSAVVRAGLEAVLELFPGLTSIRQAASLEEVEDMMEADAPDVMVVDVPESPPEGFYWRFAGAAATVMLTSGDDGEALDQAFRAGSRAVLSRDATSEEIRAALGAVINGLVALQPSSAPRLTGLILPQLRTNRPVEELTKREIEVLGLIAEGLANKTIARRLDISEHTVKFHVASIMGKLDAASRTEAVTIGMRTGYITV